MVTSLIASWAVVNLNQSRIIDAYAALVLASILRILPVYHSVTRDQYVTKSKFLLLTPSDNIAARWCASHLVWCIIMITELLWQTEPPEQWLKCQGISFLELHSNVKFYVSPSGVDALALGVCCPQAFQTTRGFTSICSQSVWAHQVKCPWQMVHTPCQHSSIGQSKIIAIIKTQLCCSLTQRGTSGAIPDSFVLKSVVWARHPRNWSAHIGSLTRCLW